jgi:hypothetical protein
MRFELLAVGAEPGIGLNMPRPRRSLVEGLERHHALLTRRESGQINGWLLEAQDAVRVTRQDD